jgi:hypothetical protein
MPASGRRRSQARVRLSGRTPRPAHVADRSARTAHTAGRVDPTAQGSPTEQARRQCRAFPADRDGPAAHDPAQDQAARERAALPCPVDRGCPAAPAWQVDLASRVDPEGRACRVDLAPAGPVGARRPRAKSYPMA